MQIRKEGEQMEQEMRVFVGCSRESVQIANAVKKNIENLCEAKVVVWDEGTFEASENFLDSLITETNESDYGVFVFAPDDEVLVHNTSVSTVRDNVLFEFGLFLGAIGPKRTFAVVPRGIELRIASDLNGIHFESYRPADLKSERFSEIVSSTKSACVVLVDIMKNQGIRREGLSKSGGLHSTEKLLKLSGASDGHGARVSISYLLNDGFETEELISSCEHWQSKGAHSFHLRPVTNVGGISPHLDTIWTARFGLRHIMEKWGEFVVAPEWLREFVYGGNNYLVSQDHPYRRCYSAFYRFAVSPLVPPEAQGMATVSLTPDINAVMTDKAWISLCTYRRYDQSVGCVYPENFHH